MEPIYPAGYTQEQMAAMFGIILNESLILPMPGSPAYSDRPVDIFARE